MADNKKPATPAPAAKPVTPTTTTAPAPATPTPAAEQAPKKEKKPRVERTLVFDDLETAKNNEPQIEHGKAPFRLYTINHLTIKDKACYVWERHPTAAAGRGYMHFGGEPLVTEPKERFGPARLATSDDILKAVGDMDEEKRKALIAQLTGAKK